jgi:hypothetical protein
MRTFGIWFFGLLASAIVGAIVGTKLGIGYGDEGVIWGGLVGLSTFACIRLWLGGQSKISN